MDNQKEYDLVPMVNGQVVNCTTNFSVKNNVATVKVVLANVKQIRSILNGGIGDTLSFSYGLRGDVEDLGVITDVRIATIDSSVDRVAFLSLEITYAEVKRSNGET